MIYRLPKLVPNPSSPRFSIINYLFFCMHTQVSILYNQSIMLIDYSRDISYHIFYQESNEIESRDWNNTLCIKIYIYTKLTFFHEAIQII